MQKGLFFWMVLFGVIFHACSQSNKNIEVQYELSNSKSSLADIDSVPKKTNFINENGFTLEERFPAPNGYKRQATKSTDFGHYLRNVTLQPHGSPVKFYDGNEKANHGVYLAVLDQDIGRQDLHQCADAIMNLYARHHFEQERYASIHFNFTNGWRCDFTKYAEGNRIQFQGNKTSWVKKKEPSYAIKTFEEYLIWIYKYCGTASLEKELVRVNDLQSIQIGDVFIKGGFPGHAVLVMDVAANDAGEKKFILGQSYMPAQQMQILQNPLNSDPKDPWYSVANITQMQLLKTPEWTFNLKHLRRFHDQ
jgi:hypothetical protein